ncbi:hypothetical protein DPMN_105033 [Dreissena polymorpha]|uniref:Uncharacterized protein n=1 Tax=Dreissena polymorpha TaxID=45954 RepID=A0A9D4HD35_DREPO|nr:hypothetical protein DPMN_105033 [Dreissena polymorpha]
MTKFFYPDARSTSGWTAVLLRFNERLRRKEKKISKKQNVCLRKDWASCRFLTCKSTQNMELCTV